MLPIHASERRALWNDARAHAQRLQLKRRS
jgi:hypothetical protein